MLQIDSGRLGQWAARATRACCGPPQMSQETGQTAPASCDRGKEEVGADLEHDPEKWKPVFRKDHAQTTR